MFPEFPARPVVPKALPGTKRYVVLDRNGQLIFESDDAAEALAKLATAGVSLCDRAVKPRLNTFAGTFSTFPPEGE